MGFFRKSPYLPKVKLYYDSSNFYTFDPLNNVRDFVVRSLSARPVFDGKSGRFSIVLTSQNASQSALNSLLDAVDVGNKIHISVGKTSAGMTPVFLGLVDKMSVTESNPKWMDVELSGKDWGSVLLGGLKVNNAVIQKTTDGTTPDPTDPYSKAKQIYQDMCTDPSWYPAQGNVIKATDLGLVVNPANINISDFNFPQFYANMESLEDKMTEIDNYLGTYHYVDPSQNLIVKQVGSEISAPLMLFTDDYDDTVAQSSFTGDKWTVISKFSTAIHDLENHAVRVYGLGGDEVQIDQKQETVSNEDAMDTNWLAQKFTPVERQLESISVYLKKVGNPTGDVTLILKEDLNNAPKGTEIARVTKSIGALTTSGDWHPFQIGDYLNTKQSYWIVIQKAAAWNAGNNVHWFRDTGTTASRGTSSDGSTWTVTNNSYSYAFRTYFKSEILTIYPETSITSANRHFVEEVIRKPDVVNRASLKTLIMGEAQTLTQKKQVIQCQVYVPDTVPVVGQKIRVRKQKAGRTFDTQGTQTNPHFILGNLEYVFESDPETQDGLLYLATTLARFLPFT